MEKFNSEGNPVGSTESTTTGATTSKKKKTPLIIVLIIAVLVLISELSVVTYQNEYRLVRQFGRVQRIITEPGISMKVPFIETIDVIPKELQIYDLPASDVITSDKKTMLVDSYVLWRVTEPLKFAQTLGGSVSNAENRIDTIVYNATKNTISNMKQDEVIMSRDGKMTVTVTSEDADVENNDLTLQEETQEVEITSLTEGIMTQINHVESQYGIEIISVDVKKLDLPDANKQAVYTRMISERENIAAQYTAEGRSQAQIIENTTDKEVSIMLSNSKANAEATVAEGEAEYMRILSDAYSDPNKSDFYSYVRALDALKESMNGGNKTVILSDDSPIAAIFKGQY